jgi:hypothetical protein
VGDTVAAVPFRIVETYKLNGVNPRKYDADVVDRIHNKGDLVTPRQFRASMFKAGGLPSTIKTI